MCTCVCVCFFSYPINTLLCQKEGSATASLSAINATDFDVRSGKWWTYHTRLSLGITEEMQKDKVKNQVIHK